MVLSNIDRELLTRCLNRSEGAWEQFVDRYLPLLAHVVLTTGSLVRTPVDEGWRDDTVGEVLLALVENDFAALRNFRGQSSLGTYLVVVARRVALKNLPRLRSIVHSIADSSEVATTDDPLNFESEDHVAAMLSQLPEQQAEAIRLFHFQQRSYREIGEMLGIAENSVGPLLSAARQRIRDANRV